MGCTSAHLSGCAALRRRVGTFFVPTIPRLARELRWAQKTCPPYGFGMRRVLLIMSEPERA